MQLYSTLPKPSKAKKGNQTISPSISLLSHLIGISEFLVKSQDFHHCPTEVKLLTLHCLQKPTGEHYHNTLSHPNQDVISRDLQFLTPRPGRTMRYSPKQCQQKQSREPELSSPHGSNKQSPHFLCCSVSEEACYKRRFEQNKKS